MNRPVACPYAFPFHFHRTLAEVDHDDRRLADITAERAKEAASKRRRRAARLENAR